ncbi:amidohydrolase [Croceicoccus ponticola]|uniref:Amidohydrolase n=1 Tax=Croceicoccus ponticola TaxID=2217664 RepID=A0A437GW75_9SPHN|nr:amidohydrolase [Croceicoccus ponticola]RVQ66354.1 amidohydrolase [Croceicoccus ponticola]
MGHKFGSIGLIFVAAGVSGCQTVATPPMESADLVLRGGAVYTVDDKNPWAEAVAVKDGRILAVGTDEEIAALTGVRTEVVELDGGMLLPAFNDAHNHPVFGGMAYSTCSLHAGKSIADYQQIIRRCLAEKPGDGMIYGVGWEDGLFPPKGIPTRELLDAVSTTRPLIFKSVGGHSYWMNSAAFALTGITKETQDPPGGLIDRDAKTGEPVGTLQESARALADPFIPPPTIEQQRDAILYTTRLFNSLGITSWHDAGIGYGPDGSSEILDAYAAAKSGGQLSAHVSLAIMWDNERKTDQIADIVKVTERARTLGFDATAIKFYLDGVIPQHTAAMIEPYSNDPHDHGETQIPKEVLLAAVSQVDPMGYQSHVHAIGDAATREALDVFEAVGKQADYNKTRPMISHLNIIDPADQPRFGKIGVTALFQPLWSVWEPYMRLTAEAVGDLRMQTIYPTASVLKGGGRIAYGADWPVASANPLQGIEVAVTRMPPDGTDEPPLLASEAVTLAQAIRSYTLDSAWTNKIDDRTGSIMPGKFADMIVLNHNLFKIPQTEIGEAEVLATYFGGRLVYRKGAVKAKAPN